VQRIVAREVQVHRGVRLNHRDAERLGQRDEPAHVRRVFAGLLGEDQRPLGRDKLLRQTVEIGGRRLERPGRRREHPGSLDALGA
jgi:hypothetical protein